MPITPNLRPQYTKNLDAVFVVSNRQRLRKFERYAAANTIRFMNRANNVLNTQNKNGYDMRGK